jgi:hypothetical protein
MYRTVVGKKNLTPTTLENISENSKHRIFNNKHLKQYYELNDLDKELTKLLENKEKKEKRGRMLG